MIPAPENSKWLMDIDKWCERQRENQKIRCPYCNAEYNFTEEDFGMVTYWGGEDGPKELDCTACDRAFFAREHVERTFTVGKTFKEADDG